MNRPLKNPGESSSNDLSPEEKAAAHSRRTFLFKLAVLLNAAVGTVLAVPLVGYLLGPATRKDSSVGSWIPLGPVEDFPVGETRLVDFVSPVKTLGDGETGKVACWVRRISTQQFQVFASTAPILAAPCAGSLSRSSSCAHAMAEPTTRTAPGRRGRRSVACSNTGTDSMGTRSQSTPEICRHWPPRLPARRSLLYKSNLRLPRRGLPHGKPEGAR